MPEQTLTPLPLLTEAEVQLLTGTPVSLELWHRLEASGVDWTDLAGLMRAETLLTGSQLHNVLLATLTAKPNLYRAARALLARDEFGSLPPLLWGQLVQAACVQPHRSDLNLICEVLEGPFSQDAQHPALGPVEADGGVFSTGALVALFGERQQQMTGTPEALDRLETLAERLLSQPGLGAGAVADAACGVLWYLSGQIPEGPTEKDQRITERLWAFAGRLGVQDEDRVLLDLYTRPGARDFLTRHSPRLRPLTLSFRAAMAHSFETGEMLFWRVWPWANVAEAAEVMHLMFTLRQRNQIGMDPSGNAWHGVLTDDSPVLGELIRRFPSPWLGQTLTDHKRWAHPAAQSYPKALLRLCGISRPLRLAMGNENHLRPPLYDLLADE